MRPWLANQFCHSQSVSIPQLLRGTNSIHLPKTKQQQIWEAHPRLHVLYADWLISMYLPMPAGPSNLLSLVCNGDWRLQLFPVNKELPGSVGHKLVLIESPPFEHTACCFYQWDNLGRPCTDTQWMGTSAHSPGRALRRQLNLTIWRK